MFCKSSFTDPCQGSIDFVTRRSERRRCFVDAVSVGAGHQYMLRKNLGAFRDRDSVGVRFGFGGLFVAGGY
jgi:hypothetical protein